ncbi:MAG: hypothetical protein ACKODK_18985, partial [Opitutaceae bacterium]
MKSRFQESGKSEANSMCGKPTALTGLVAFFIVLAGVDCRAQFELKRGSLNQLFVASASVPGAGSPSITTPQFKGIQVTSAASSATAISGAISAQYPSAIYRTSYPSGAPTGTAVVLVRSGLGNPFASGVPKYLFADVIFPPLAREGGSTAAEAGYWRPWPVQPGETFSQPGSSAVGTPVRFASIRLDVGGSGYTSAPVVTITGGGGVGATATAVVSGGTVTAINLTAPGYGFTGVPVVSIAAPVSGTRATATAITEEYAPSSAPVSVYYSPHAGKVFASQAGRVSVTWVTSAPQTVPGSSEVRYLFRQEIFNVSSASSVPTRRMYWTEKEYTAPPVRLPAQGVTAAPVYNSNFPALVGDDFSFGYLDSKTGQLVVNTAAASQERRTLWLQSYGGVVELRAYNVEGRILIEYLGPLLPGESVKREYLGADVVDVLRVMPNSIASVDIGEKIVPLTNSGGVPSPSSAQWQASPVGIASQGETFYGSTLRADGVIDYYAERQNLDPDRAIFYWLESRSSQIEPAPASGKFAPTVQWPAWRNSYSFVWPSSLGSYVHYLVPSGGSTAATGAQLSSGKIPQIVFQDDPAQKEAAVDPLLQRITVAVPSDGFNRSLLKFSSENAVWYVRLFSQGVDRSAFQEPDGPAINATATVGQRLVAPAGYATAGYIQAGRNYLEAAYKNPASLGVAEASSGAIIPVNARPEDRVLKVWWYKEIQSPGNVFGSFFVPSKQGIYTTSFPTTAPEIVMASNAGSGPLTAAEGAGSLYIQNVAGAIGYNPNEEHAVMTGGVVYALRDDLNNTSAGSSYTSDKFVLLSYTSPTDGRPAMTAFKVLRENATYTFNYPVTAGTMLQPPMPLAVLPLALDPETKVSKNREATVTNGSDSSLLNAGVPTALKTTYQKFTFKDRKGFDWVYRGPHATSATNAAFGMQFWYPMQNGFFIPGLATQPTVGTPLPYLLSASSAPYSGAAVSSGNPVVITYRPAWPQFAPTLRVAETLTLPKSGLPTVYGQTSAQVLYQQSYATDLKTSVVLHDSFREKTLPLGSAAGLLKLPVSIATVSDAGKTYFQRLPPHLQRRFYYDPLRGNSGTLVLLGQLVQEPVGESYLNLNVLSGDDLRVLGELVGTSDPDAAAWATAIASLATTVETFRPDPVNPSRYRREASLDRTFTSASVVEISDAESAVVNYALTAPGAGAGWVTLVFGGGSAFTPGTEPVDMQIIRVVPDLYPGEMKVLFSENPLDEQVTLRHTADFRGQPSSYEFEWRYAQPGADGQAPAVYAYAMSSRLQSSAWKMIRNPEVLRPAQSVYDAASTVALARQTAIKDSSWTAWATDLRPGIALRAANVDFSAGVPVRVIFSASALLPQSGWELYVNNVKVLTYKKPGVTASAAAASGLLKEEEGGLPLQFELPTGFFQKGSNQIEVLLYTKAAVETLETLDFRLHAAQEADQVVAVGSPWVRPNGDLTNIITVGGSPTNPLSTPLLMLGDNYFTMRYRPKPGSGLVVSDTTWSRWADPKLVEGFVKRALAGINPFNQRIKSFGSASIDTDVSVLTEAGKRWEGNVALSLANINNFGLIEIYETLLNRARAISIDAGYDDPSANNALLLAAGYLNDLYVVLGNEAFADAANSTIAVDQGSNITTVNTSRFAFEGQVANVLEEELGLLRGRDDLLAPGVRVAPIYNRMYWNYTRGINSGEAFYALNYNIREAASGPATNGTVDAADAQWMFPQGHGDAYGHYLTAVKGYYRLLQSPKFTWSPRAETVTVLGQPVTVDYYDERRFADSAASVARTAQQILNLTYRQAYQDGSAGWSQFRDGRYNSNTGVSRYWGVDEWASRSIQGAYFHWLTANSMLPDVDLDSNKSGVQRIDRTTVPGISELAVVGGALQSTLDSANARLNPLGLSPGAIAFDISPIELKAGKSHFEQVYDRALQAALNAKGAFDQASKMSAMLRGQENQSSGYLEAYTNQEASYNRQLVEIFGRPYSGSVGAGKIYAQGYEGPDQFLWFLIDRPSGLVDTGDERSLTLSVPKEFKQVTFENFDVGNIGETANALLEPRSIKINPNRFVQFADQWSSPLGSRPVVGSLQQALLSSYTAQVELLAAADRFLHKYEAFKSHLALLQERDQINKRAGAVEAAAMSRINSLRKTVSDLELSASVLEASADLAQDILDATEVSLPEVLGFSNDFTAPARGALKFLEYAVKFGGKTALIALGATAISLSAEKDKISENLPVELAEITGSYEDAQVGFELQLRFREASVAHYEVAQSAAKLQAANESVGRALNEANRILAERTLFRQRAAAVVQGYRTRDVAFRTFRNEALEQYRTLFDLASRYTYLAAKSYDYETGLLGSTAGQGVLNSIVAARSLGDLTGNVPRATAGSTGDAGLAGAMAKLQSDWSVAKSRLGINNPDQNGTVFSLRRELFRIRDDPAITTDDTIWRQTLEQNFVPNLLADPDVALLCRNLQKPDGSSVPGIILSFRTAIQHGQNFFGLSLAEGDHAFSASNYSTKIYSVGVVLSGYVGIDPNLNGSATSPVVFGTTPNALSATPYIYLIPTGTDYMRAPPLGDTDDIRGWQVADQALPLPYNLGATKFSSSQYVYANGSLMEVPWVTRRHNAFRAVSEPSFFYSSIPAEFTSSRLVGRSVWNS